MREQEIYDILKNVASGNLMPDEAIEKLRLQPFTDLDFAKVDHHRHIRQGMSEVIYAAGKTPDQIRGICQQLKENNESNILITRLSPEKAADLADLGLVYHPEPKLAVFNPRELDLVGNVVVATGGTSDQPVAEEAALTLETLGSKVTRIYDVGIAGLHRLLAQLETLQRARVIVAVAGMEGALASVIGGLVSCPVVAVPTSVGYGANFQGLSALLTMLNSCSSGIGVVNIDNGFGAGVLAHKINKMDSPKNQVID